MSILKLVWNYLKSKPLNTALNIVLLSLGIGMITILVVLNNQIEEKINQNAKGIDLVVGAKGSPLQLILCNIFYIDFPTGNIKLAEAPSFGHSIFDYAPTCPGSIDYIALAKEVLTMEPAVANQDGSAVADSAKAAWFIETRRGRGGKDSVLTGLNRAEDSFLQNGEGLAKTPSCIPIAHSADAGK